MTSATERILDVGDRVIVVVGGLEALAAELKVNCDDLRDALEAGATLMSPDIGGGATWTYDSQRSAPGRPAVLRINPSPLLVPPLYARGRSYRSVPLLGDPPAVGGPHTRLAHYRLQDVVVAHLAARRREIAAYGGVSIDEATWARLHDEAGVTDATRETIMTAAQSDAGGWLARLEDGRWTLSNHTVESRNALAFLVASGRASERASAAGKASSRARGGRR